MLSHSTSILLYRLANFVKCQESIGNHMIESPGVTVCFFLQMLPLCHVGHGHQIFMHVVHKVALVLVLVGCVAMLVVIIDVWREGWILQLHSLMVTCIMKYTIFS